VANAAVVCMFIVGILNDRKIIALKMVWKEAAVSWFEVLPEMFL
jgi:hypothetical protein